MSPADVRPFEVAVPDEVLSDLRDRLDRARWPDSVPDGGVGGTPTGDSGWDYGTDLAYLQDLVAYWRDGYDWRAQEKEINQFPHYKAQVGGIDVHFIHAPGVGPNPMPLLLCHGWPGSFWEFDKIIPMLTDPGRFGGDPADAFTVVAPSLPGYGFSFQPGQRRFDIPSMADVLGELMVDVLGYERFGGQGGDWGSGVVSRLAYNRPQNMDGIHLNLMFARPGVPEGQEPTPEEAVAVAEIDWWLKEGTGYQWIQGTRPQTLSYALNDSPVGLCGWIVEKLRAWSDCDGNPERRFSRDWMLTNIMIYWVNGAIGSSFWPYYAMRHGNPPLVPGERITVPAGYASFPKEIVHPPRAWAETVYDIRRWSVMPAGGHFAAQEEPAALAEDVRAFFREVRP